MDRLITQVLELEKFESGKQELYPEELEINDLIRESISATRKLIDKHNIALTLDLQEHDYHVIADRDRIIQVILNLLSNAIKFCDQQQGELLLSSYYIDGEVKVKVVDNGRGVPEAIQESIFEVFYQVPDQNRKKPKGSGLGLSICQKIIEHHNGRIWVESEEGKGAIFAFTLPAIFKRREQKKEEAESEKSINSR
jgi:signal transduction histidine kinase